MTSIEPVYWGVGNDFFAFLITYHQHGEQKHPTAGWLKELVKHPREVLGASDPRHWAERTVVMLCTQTTDTSIELYWHDGLLRSRHSDGAAPSVHVPIIEEFVDRMAAKMNGHEGALPFEVINRTAIGPLHRRDPDRRQQRERRRRPLPAPVRPAGSSRDRRERDAGQHRGEPVADDHRPGRARDVAVAEQRRPGPQAAPGLRLRARRPGHAAPSGRARRRSSRAALDAKKADVVPEYPY